MDNVVTIPEAFFYLVGGGEGATDFQFEDRWRIDDAAVALAESACSCCQGLLAHRQRINPAIQRSKMYIKFCFLKSWKGS